MIGFCLDFTNTNDVEKKTSILLASWGDALLTTERFANDFTSVIMPRLVKKLETAPEWVIQESSVIMEGFTLTGIHAVCYKSSPKSELLHQSTSSSSEYYAILGHISIKSSASNMVFPRASEWHVESENLDWRSSSEGHKTVSLKILWTLNSRCTSLFSKYNIYVEDEASESGQESKYVGVALVEAFYVSEFLVPTGISSLKFIIQACTFDGACQELVDSPFLRLHVEGL